MRLRCHLFGCSYSDHFPGCERCGAGIYDAEFIGFDQSRFYRPRLFWRWLRRPFRRIVPRCDQCSRRLWPWRRWWTRDFCSEACQSKWIPF